MCRKPALPPRSTGAPCLKLPARSWRLARSGLTRRGHVDTSGHDETRYLEILEDRLARGTTPAQELFDKYHGPWAKSVDPIYTEEAY